MPGGLRIAGAEAEKHPRIPQHSVEAEGPELRGKNH